MATSAVGFISKKLDDEIEPAYEKLNKGEVIQNIRLFGAPKVKASESLKCLCQILFLITCKSEGFTKQEATNIFFAVTKLFQSKDLALRRMMYLLLKELSPLADDTIIAFAILIKDVNSDVPMNQANAIRVISGIMDPNMLTQMERYLKQAMVSHNTYVASSALVSSYHLFNRGGTQDVIRRWVNEVQEVLRTGKAMSQYHALGLLYMMKQNDRMAITKLVQSCASGGTLRSVHAHVILIRYCLQICAAQKQRDSLLFRYLESCLRHVSDMVVYEAVRAIISLPDLTEADLAAPVGVLTIFLTSSRTTQRYAAAKTLSQIANRFPSAISASCVDELEKVISDPSRSVAALAITTLLKIEAEDRVEMLLEQIALFVTEIEDDFRVVAVEAVRLLSQKYPSKHESVLKFLSKLLLNRSGSFEFKNAIVSTILTIVGMKAAISSLLGVTYKYHLITPTPNLSIFRYFPISSSRLERSPESKKKGLEYLCEFIEDCDHADLSCKILHLLGEEGPMTDHPTRFIRVIYNRIILESPQVRAAAVSALSKFGLLVPSLTEQVCVLLRRSWLDPDDEVRDRAIFNLSLLEQSQQESKVPWRGKTVVEPFELPLENLEAALVGYLGSAPSENPFLISSVPSQAMKRPPPPTTSSLLPTMASPLSPVRAKTPENDEAQASLAKKLAKLQELFGKYGRLLNTTQPQALTESETAYQITLVKHIYMTHIVLEYDIINTLSDQMLKDVTVDLRADHGFSHSSASSLVIEAVIPADEVAPNNVEPALVFVVLKRPAEAGPLAAPRQTYSHSLAYTAHEVDKQTGEVDENGFPDEFPLDDFKIGLNDFMRAVVAPQFHEKWNVLGAEREIVAGFVVRSVSTLKDAIATVMRSLGMAAVDHTNEVDEKKSRHILYLSGMFVALNAPVGALAQVKMMYPKDGQGVAIQVAIRTDNAALGTALSQAMLSA